MHHEEEHKEKDLIDGDGESKDEEFAIVFAAMGVNMETAHFFKQARDPTGNVSSLGCHVRALVMSDQSQATQAITDTAWILHGSRHLSPDANTWALDPNMTFRIKVHFRPNSDVHLSLCHVASCTDPFEPSAWRFRISRRTGPWTRPSCS